MRVLLIESDLEDTLYLKEVLSEIREGRYGSNWVNTSVLEAHSWKDALTVLAENPVDVILLDLDLADIQGPETFRQAQLAAQSIPMIVLVGGFEESLGVQLVREG